MDTPDLWWGSIKTKPRHLPELAIRLFGIIVSQASCERNFSTLKWIIGDRQTRFGVQKLENMLKIRSYYLTNIKRELAYYGKQLTIEDLKEIANDCSVGNVMTLGLEEETSSNFSNTNLNLDLSNTNSSKDTLVLEDIIDLTLPIFDNVNNELHDEQGAQDTDPPNLDYDPEELVNAFLQDE